MANSLSAINDEYLSDSLDEDETEEKSRKTYKTLPVPESILLMEGVPHHEEKIDNPLDHGGRIRSFKHERGNWSTLIYIDYRPSDEMFSWIKSLETLLPKDGNIQDQFHLSLTRTVVLKYHLIESFVESLKKLSANLMVTKYDLLDIKVYCNEERTRTFLAIVCNCFMFQYFVAYINKLMAEYQLPLCYKDGSYHISIFWWVGDKEDCLNKVLPSIKSSFQQFCCLNFEDTIAFTEEIHCKIGNKLYKFPLKIFNDKFICK
ncbi:hypothetical protein M0802_006854 [Mischocyttarus mexicanus]|nr:hypothetical protein M0802_006854 [Mischocyttarus mexicanus]